MTAATRGTPQHLWETFSERISGRPLMRLDVRGDNSYARRRAWTRELPAEPATVMLYDNKTQLTRCLAADFDVGKKGRQFAAAEANTFAKLIERCGGRVIIDGSPTGGRHVYVVLATPRHFNVVKPLMQALRKRFSTLDIGPMLNPDTGSIRPPGAVHRGGGHQLLETCLYDALAALRTPNGDHVWRALLSNVGPVQRAPATLWPASFEDYATDLRWRGRKRWLRPECAEIARTGQFDKAAHPTWTPSEARQSVVGAAFRAGWLLPEVAAQLEPGGAWQGLRQLYDRKWHGPDRRLQQLTYEWSKAKTFTEGEKHVHRSDRTGLEHAPPGPTGHSEFAWLREWWTAMRLAERDRYAGRLSTRMVLRALAAAAQRRGSRYTSYGVRSLALACNLDHSTVARVLRTLREESDPLIDLIEGDRGDDRPDIYGLRIPDEYQRQASTTPWRPGKFEAIHHVFLELGVPAAFVFEALGEHAGPLPAVDVAEAAMLSRSAAALALRTLAEFGLAERGPGGWQRGPGSLDHIGEQLGTTELFQDRIRKIRDERVAYKQWLKEHIVDRAAEASPTEPPVDMWATGLREAPADEESERLIVLPDVAESSHEDAVILLERDLGAVALPP